MAARQERNDTTMPASGRAVIDEQALDRLMDQVDADGLELLGPDGVLTELTSRIMNRALDAELTDHLGMSAATRPDGGRATTATARPPRRC